MLPKHFLNSSGQLELILAGKLWESTVNVEQLLLLPTSTALVRKLECIYGSIAAIFTLGLLGVGNGINSLSLWIPARVSGMNGQLADASLYWLSPFPASQTLYCCPALSDHSPQGKYFSLFYFYIKKKPFFVLFNIVSFHNDFSSLGPFKYTSFAFFNCCSSKVVSIFP